MSAPLWDVVGVGENSVDLILTAPRAAGFGPAPRCAMRAGPRGRRTGRHDAVHVRVAGPPHRIRRRVRQRRGRGGSRDANWSGAAWTLGAALTRAAATRQAVILVEPGGERVMLWSRDSVLALASGGTPGDTVAARACVHVDAVDAAAAFHAARLARAGGRHRDVRHRRRRRRMPRPCSMPSTHPVVAEHVPEAITGEPDVERALRALRRRQTGPIA